MAVNKVIYGTTVLVDLTEDTVTPSALAEGYTAHDKSGAAIVGTATGGSMVIRDTQDSHGGTIRNITAGSVVQGTKTITENGTYDVASYADALVNVPSAEPELQAKTATPSTSQQVITADSGYDGLSQVTVSAMPSGSATTPTTSITANPSISVNSFTGLITASVSGSKSVTPSVSAGYVSSGTAGTVSVSGSNTSQLTTQAAKTVTPSTSSQTAVAAGRYTTGAVTVAAMPSGTAGTPTATKGSVSDHSVTVTPSVTNTTGYITGGTKSGTAVTVSASELVSGTLSVTGNGTVDVTNYASASVNVPTSNDFVVTLTYNATTGMWEPDCTFAEAYAAYQSNKNIVSVAFEEVNGTTNALPSDMKYAENQSFFVYTIFEVFNDWEGNFGYVDKSYSLTSSGIDSIGGNSYYAVDGADAQPSDVASGKTFYNTEGFQTGTASGITVNPLSVTSNGTYTAPTGTAYSPVTVNVSSGGSGGGGLEYETGTWTPASDISSYEIQFSNSHSTAPFMYLVADATNTYSDVTYSIYSVAFVDWFAAFNASFNTTESAHRHGRMQYSYRSSETVVSDGGTNLSDSTSQGTTASTLYWANTTRIRAYTNGTSRYWRAGRTYKWIAVWAPTS